MKQKKLQRLIVYSSEEVKERDDLILSIDAKLNQTSISYTIEKIINEHYFTNDRQIAIAIKSLLNNYWDNPVGLCLDSIFNYNASIIELNKNRAYDCFKLIEFCEKETKYIDQKVDKDQTYTFHFLSNFESIVNFFKQKCLDEEYLKEFGPYDVQIRKNVAESYLNLAKENEKIDTSSFYLLFNEAWGQLRNLSVTYRCLSDLVLMQKNWRTDNEIRFELSQILREIAHTN